MPRPHDLALAVHLADPADPCQKCGSELVTRTWIGAGPHRDGPGLDLMAFHLYLGPWPTGEFLLCLCQGCGYGWAAACLDTHKRSVNHAQA